MTPTIRIVHNLARSGGTIFARCLGCMDGVALLSEVHELGRDIADPATGFRPLDPIRQAREWYGLDVQRRATAAADVRAIADECADRGLALVVRTWDHADFVPSMFNREPPMRSTMAYHLGITHRLARLALVREPVGMWLSLSKHEAMRSDVAAGAFTPEVFLRSYRAFAEMAYMLPIVHYEDFCADPGAALADACEQLDLPFDAGWAAKWHLYRNVTGDIANQGDRDRIETWPRDVDEQLLGQFFENADYQAACRLLGY